MNDPLTDLFETTLKSFALFGYEVDPNQYRYYEFKSVWSKFKFGEQFLTIKLVFDEQSGGVRWFFSTSVSSSENCLGVENKGNHWIAVGSPLVITKIAKILIENQR